MKGEARREVEQGPTALSYSPEFRHTYGAQHMVKFLFLCGGRY
jgi:hypothetical protein